MEIEESRTSRMAMASLLLAAVTVAAWCGITAEDRSGDGKNLITATSGLTIVWGPIAGFALADLSLLRIKVSEGTLRGKGIAIAGLVAATLLIAGIVIAGSRLPIHR